MKIKSRKRMHNYYLKEKKNIFFGGGGNKFKSNFCFYQTLAGEKKFPFQHKILKSRY